MTSAHFEPNDGGEPNDVRAAPENGLDPEGNLGIDDRLAPGAKTDAETGVGTGAGDGDPSSSNRFDASGLDASGLEQLLGDEVARIASERDEYLASLQRLQADFDNFRKRSVRQQTEMLERAAEGVLTQLLPVLDALDLALAHLGGEPGEPREPREQNDHSSAPQVPRGAESGQAGDGAASLVQIASLLRTTLERDGLTRIDAVGVDFDPTVHDAVAHEASEDGGETAGAQVVAEVMRSGYRLNGRVIRPAMVKVRG